MSLQTINYMVLESADNEWHTVDYNHFAIRFGKTNLKLRPMESSGRIGFEIDFGPSGGKLRFAATTKGPNVSYAPNAGGS
jgi:hypothetical protein